MDFQRFQVLARQSGVKVGGPQGLKMEVTVTDPDATGTMNVTSLIWADSNERGPDFKVEFALDATVLTLSEAGAREALAGPLAHGARTFFFASAKRHD